LPNFHFWSIVAGVSEAPNGKVHLKTIGDNTGMADSEELGDKREIIDRDMFIFLI
jgi:hypothetical protein